MDGGADAAVNGNLEADRIELIFLSSRDDLSG